MAYNTRSIKKDVDGRPIPQYYNQMTDDYEPLLGENGAARSILWGPNGQPLSVVDNKLAVRAADLETLIGALNDSAVTNPANAASVIAALKGLLSVVGKDATLGQILLALGSLATESTLASLVSSVAKEATLSGVKSAVDTLAGIVSDGAAKVTLSGQNVEVTQLANALEVTPGATAIINHNPQNPVTAYSLVVTETFSVVHSFTVRLVEWPVRGNTSRYWFDGIVSTTATTNTQRFPKQNVVGGAGTFQLRITNNDASSRFYDAVLTTWGV